jgi:hypothetical protein
MRPEGRLLLTVHDDQGTLVAERRTKNRVTQRGANLIAELFSGKRAKGIDRVRFGYGTDPLPLEATDLRKRIFTEFGMFLDLDPLPEQALAANDFSVEIKPDVVTVTARVSFLPQSQLTAVSEAGLFSETELYNHVLFEPLDMVPNQTVTFFWKIDFPYGA